MPYYKGPSIPLHVSGPNCAGCPFRDTSYGFAPGVGPQGAKVMFIAEALGRDEVAEGRPLVGAIGRKFNVMLIEHSSIRRSESWITNCVKCRSVKRGFDGEPLRFKNGDFINDTPSPAQVRECYQRYLKYELEAFQGELIVGLGATSLSLFMGRPTSIKQFRGTPLEAGESVPCSACAGTGELLGRLINCKVCKGRGRYKCVECGGVSKHKKSCVYGPLFVGNLREVWDSCISCTEGKVQGKPRRCKECSGGGTRPKDPGNPYVSTLLRPGQVFVATYHPAFLNKQPQYCVDLESDLAQLEHIIEELRTPAIVADYQVNPATEAGLKYLDGVGPTALDLEYTRGLEPDNGGEIYNIGASRTPGTGVVMSWDPYDSVVEEMLLAKFVVGQYFFATDMWWLWHKASWAPWRKNSEWRLWDTYLAGHLLQPDAAKDIYSLQARYASPRMRGFWKSKQDYRDDKDKVALLDTDADIRIYHGQVAKLQETGQLHIMHDDVMPLTSVLMDMRIEGMRVDRERMAQVAKRLDGEITREREKLPEWGGTRTENQSAEVQRYLYNVLKLPVISSRDSGRPTADYDALVELEERLQSGHASIRSLSSENVRCALDFLRRIKGLRSLSKLRGSFYSHNLGTQDKMHPKTDPAGTATFRFSTYDPFNPQQTPKCNCEPECYETLPTCTGARGVFISDYDDWEIGSFDLKQAEVIGFLWEAQEWKVLKDILVGGLDAHHAIGTKLFGREITRQERDFAKSGVTFAFLYGEAPETSAARLHRKLGEILALREQYVRMLPGVADYRRAKILFAQKHGYVESAFGTRRYIRVESHVGVAANKACNTPIQTIPAMVTRAAMIRAFRELPKPARLWLQVHDEILTCHPVGLRKQVYECMRDILTSPVRQMPAAPVGMAGGLRFNIDAAFGPHWGALKEWKP